MMMSKRSFDRASISERLIKSVRQELPWSSESQAEAASFHAQDLAEVALMMLCDEPGRELTEEQRAEFVFWNAETLLMLAITQVKEWGLWDDREADQQDDSAAPDNSSDHDLLRIMLRASYILSCLGVLDEDGEQKMQQVGGEDWQESMHAEIGADKQTLLALQSVCKSSGMSEKRANSFILTGFGCGFGGGMLTGAGSRDLHGPSAGRHSAAE